MADKSGISWTDSSLSLWIGCTVVSPACDHCYARAIALRFKMVEAWDAPPVRTAASAWKKIASYQRTAKRFFAKHGRRRRVFINHMADFFDNRAEPSWQIDACNDMEEAPDVVFILVTKRPQNVHKRVPPRWLRPGGWPENVWLLVTTENQIEYDRRCAVLLDIPAPVRGTSMEPMLEPIRPWAHGVQSEHSLSMSLSALGKRARYLRPLEWNIIGGESGQHARPMPEAAARDIIERLLDTPTAVFVKQRSQADHPKTFGNFGTFPRFLQHREFPDER